MDDDDKKVLADIEEYGWHIVQVLEDEEGPTFSYSVGMYRTLGRPEVIVIGLPIDLAKDIINGIGQGIRNGAAYTPGQEYDDILEGYKCAFVEVGSQWYREYFGYATWLYKGNDYPVVQCVWPNMKGHYPWAAEFEESLKWRQPVLTGDSDTSGES